MKTVFIAQKDAQSKKVLEKAAEIIKAGGLVAFPTETVYGLGGSALDPDAAEKIYRAKGRPSDNPLIIHITDPSDAEKYAYTNELYYKITERFSPGAITVILKKRDIIPSEVTGGLDSVAIRIPSHPVARAFIDACGIPIAAPSANLSGRPSPTLAEHVLEDLDGRIDMIIDGGASELGLESTVVSIKDGNIVILRPGAVTEEMLAKLAPVTGDRTLLQKPSAELKPESPGMKYKHYAPKAPVFMLKGQEADVLSYMKKRLSEDPDIGIITFYKYRRELFGRNVMYLPSEADGQAHELFAVLRAFDKTEAKSIYSVIPSSRSGIGLAVINRLSKASGFCTLRVSSVPYTVGITGQTGSGKGEVSRIMKASGIHCIDCDRVYSSLLYPDSPLMESLTEHFGRGIVNEDGTLNRRALSAIVFSDKAELSELNRITHGKVIEKVNKELEELYNSGVRIAAVDAPQLFESGFDMQCDKVIGVVCPEDIRLSRIMKRDGLTIEEARHRSESQHPESFFRVHCDVTLENASDLLSLEEKVIALVSQLKAEASK